MPTYDFRCPNGHLFEQRFARISEAPSVFECPTCGAVAERQISGGAGLVFKGSGFYITDYGKDGKKDQRTAGATSSADASKSGADAKTAAAGDGKASESKSSDSKSGESKSSDSKPAESTSKPAASTPAAAPAPKPSSSA